MLNHLKIGLAAAQLGVSAATLRKWESRYGFPRPIRSENGERLYDETQLNGLYEAKRLLDQGRRAGDVFRQLRQGAVITTAVSEHAPDIDQACVDELIELLKAHKLDQCSQRIRRQLSDNHVIETIEYVLAPLMEQVGDSWEYGELELYQEHALTFIVQSALQEITLNFGRMAGPTVLLATPPGERHNLGLALLQLAITSSGGRCVNLSDGGLPADQAAMAAKAYGAAIVGVSINTYDKPRIMQEYLCTLRDRLPTGVALWVGGRGVEKIGTLPDNIRHFIDTRTAAAELRCERG